MLIIHSEVLDAMVVSTKDTHQTSQRETNRQADELYARYGKPLEAEHYGEFVAISTQGVVVHAPTLQQVLDLSLEQLGPGSYVFRLGADRSVFRWR